MNKKMKEKLKVRRNNLSTVYTCQQASNMTYILLWNIDSYRQHPYHETSPREQRINIVNHGQPRTCLNNREIGVHKEQLGPWKRSLERAYTIQATSVTTRGWNTKPTGFESDRVVRAVGTRPRARGGSYRSSVDNWMPISQRANRRFHRIVISYGVYTRCTSCISAATDAIEESGGKREREREGVECRDGGYDRTTREKGETKRVAVTRAMTRFQSASNARSRGPRPSLTQLTFGHAVYFKRITRPSLRNPLPSWPLSRHQLASSQFQAKLSFSSRSIRSIDPGNTRHAIGDGLCYRERCFV